MLKDLFPKKKRHQYATIERTEITRPTDAQKDVPKGLVNKCGVCGSLLMARELEKHLHTCPHCGYHFPIGAPIRLELTLDEDSFTEYDADVTSADPLGFPDYSAKLKKARESSGLDEAVVTGHGRIDSQPVVVGVMDSRFMMGSMGSASGEKIARAMEKAAEERIPMILFTASGGARMQEGILSLMQMAKTSAALKRMDELGVLFVTVITHPTTGGVSASFASLGDIVLAEPGALFGFAGRRVIEQTIRQKLPDDFQTAEFNLKHGMVDKVIHRKELRGTLSAIVRMHGIGGRPNGK